MLPMFASAGVIRCQVVPSTALQVLVIAENKEIHVHGTAIKVVVNTEMAFFVV